jgi:hypothetical protein
MGRTKSLIKSKPIRMTDFFSRNSQKNKRPRREEQARQNNESRRKNIFHKKSRQADRSWGRND